MDHFRGLDLIKDGPRNGHSFITMKQRMPHIAIPVEQPSKQRKYELQVLNLYV